MSHGHDHDPSDPELCICFHVPMRKIVGYCRRERPKVASLISQCFGAGTGCGWCVPFIRAIHSEIVQGGPPAEVPGQEEYLSMRKDYHKEKGINRD
jgi:bacterioferritin-associated ferredoxin